MDGGLNMVAPSGLSQPTRVIWTSEMNRDLIALVEEQPNKTSNKNLKKEGWAVVTRKMQSKYPRHPWKNSSCSSRWTWLKDAFVDFRYARDRLKGHIAEGEKYYDAFKRQAADVSLDVLMVLVLTSVAGRYNPDRNRPGICACRRSCGRVDNGSGAYSGT